MSKKMTEKGCIKSFKMPERLKNVDFNSETNTRFPKGSARQFAFEMVLKHVKAGLKLYDIRKKLTEIRKENGYGFNLDMNYANFVISSHPEYFQVYTDGTVELIEEPVIKIKSLDEERRKKFQKMRKTAREIKRLRGRKHTIKKGIDNDSNDKGVEKKSRRS